MTASSTVVESLPGVSPSYRIRSPSFLLSNNRFGCAGCGVKLQSRDQVAAGYIPSLKQLQDLEDAAAAALSVESKIGTTKTFSGHGLVCQRCFNMKNHNHLIPTTIPAKVFTEYAETLRGLRPGTAVLLQVIDLFDFQGSLLDLGHLLRGQQEGGHVIDKVAGASPPPPKPLILAINKIDLLPPSTNLERIEAWVRQQLVSSGLLAASKRKIYEDGGLGSSVPAAEGGALLLPRRNRTTSGDQRKAAVAVSIEDAWIEGEAGGGSSAGNASATAAPPLFYLHSLELISAKKDFGLRRLRESIDAARKEAASDARLYLRQTAHSYDKNGGPAATTADDNRYTDVYVLGAPNVGKSSVINGILSHVWNLSNPDSRRKKDLGKRAANSPLAAMILDEEDVKAAELAVAALAKGNSTPQTQIQEEEEMSPQDADIIRRAILSARSERQKSARKLEEDGSSSGAPMKMLDSNSSDLLDATLKDWTSRKQRYKSPYVKEEEKGVEAPMRLGGYNSARVDNNAMPEAHSNDASKLLFNPGAPPSIPFTTSPLPGTTLGIIGAALDPHGHAHIYDTPGIINDPEKQQMLEFIATLDNSPLGASVGEEPPKQVLLNKHALAKLKKKGLSSSATMTDPHKFGPHSSNAALSLVVPLKRPAFPIVRLFHGKSVFLGGLVRIDFENSQMSSSSNLSDPGILVTVASRLPLHVTHTLKADELWMRHAGSRLESDQEDIEVSADADKPSSGLLSPWYKSLSNKMRIDLAAYSNKQSLFREPSLFSPSMLRRKKFRIRKDLFEVSLGGIGFCVISPVAMEGLRDFDDTLRYGSITIHASTGISIGVRQPLLTNSASGTSGTDWLS